MKDIFYLTESNHRDFYGVGWYFVDEKEHLNGPYVEYEDAYNAYNINVLVDNYDDRIFRRGEV